MKYVFVLLFALVLMGCTNNIQYDWSDHEKKDLLFVSHLKEPLLSVIDPEMAEIVEVFELPFTASDMVYIEKKNVIVLSSQQETDLYTLDLESGGLSSAVEVGEGVASLLYDEREEMIYAAHSHKDRVSQVSIDPFEKVAQADTDDHPLSMDVDSNQNHLYVANVYGNTIQVLHTDGLEVIDTLKVIDRPNGVLLVEDGLLVGGHGPFGDLNRDTYYRTFEGEDVLLETGLMPIDIIRGGERGYVISHGSHEVTAVDLSSMEVVDQVEVPHNPYYGIMSPSELIVSSLDGDAVTFIDPRDLTIKTKITVQAGPHAMVYVRH
ncbi:YncE family protein [Alteribacter aurantiacus]|uniref:YncE family protein n=1 Tax=Alteribacter aurantiacus TaxID=254410 RepID=UPI00042069E8|nr:beta-propeller fold lactonase family protein [Alteribacter aurantiacus]